jgi:polyisoprenoid-binding protein YceI
MVLVLTVAFVLVVPAAAETSWGIDPAHTEINFSVKHFFTPVTGSFGEFDVELVYDAENPERSRVEVRIPVASIDTGSAMRDKHLRSADWFEADEHAYITFVSDSVQKKGKDQLVARGSLTIKGVSREIKLPIKLLGSQQIPKPMREMMNGAQEVASFQASLTVDRADFGVGVGSWAATMIVGGEVTIDILAEAHLR